MYIDSKNTQYGTSSYWMGAEMVEKLDSGEGTDLVELAAFQRAIANFVRITTGKSIPVKYNVNNSSFTNGDSIVISAKLDQKKFDCNVGLALHEASHCLLTDFKLLNKLRWDESFISFAESVLEAKDAKSSSKQAQVFNIIKNILNVVEDRRIDHFVYNNAPGYRGYYMAFYAEYFNSSTIDMALKYNIKNNETIEDYMFHLINIMNPNRNLKCLKKLQQVSDVLGLYTIDRLKNTTDALSVTFKIAEILKDEIKNAVSPSEEPKLEPNKQDADPKLETNPNKEKSETEETEEDVDSEEGEESGEDSSEGEGTDLESNSTDRVDIDPSDSIPSDSAETSSSSKEGDKQETTDSTSSTNEEDTQLTEDDLTPAQKKRIAKDLEKDIKQQEETLSGENKKKSVNKTIAKELEAIAEASAEFEDVNKNGTTKRGKGTKCIVINKVNDSVIESVGSVLFYSKQCAVNFKEAVVKNPNYLDSVGTYSSSYASHYKAVIDGIRMGNMLGRKLKVRNENQSLATSRLTTGRIDKRLIAEIGYGVEAVFSKIVHKTVQPVHIHYSIDASGSMGGLKAINAIKSATAVAKACSMIEGVSVTIDFRTTYNSINRTSYPCVINVYDSKKDPITQLYKIAHVCISGSTPEGLCFEAVTKKMSQHIKGGAEGIFINISDGQPCYSDTTVHYSGSYAQKHTRDQIRNIKSLGYKVLSYFVSERNYEASGIKSTFDYMYGKDSTSYIDVTNLTALAKTINECLLAPVHNNQ